MNAWIKDFIFLAKAEIICNTTEATEKNQLNCPVSNEKLYFSSLIVQTTPTWGVADARLPSSNLWTSQRSEPQQFRIDARLTSDQLKVSCNIISCTRSRTSEGSLVLSTLTLVRESCGGKP